MKAPTLFALLLLAACGGTEKAVDSGKVVTTETTGDDDDDDTASTTSTTSSTTDCGASAPAVDGVSVANGGLVDPGTGGGDVPSLMLTIDASDADGDLHDLSFEIDLDPVFDGVLDPIGTSAGSGTTGQAACSVPALQLQLQVPIDGTNITFDTHYDLGLRVLDAAGNMSETWVFDAITPNEDGTDGDGV